MTEQASTGGPYNGVAATVPGVIQAEEFDEGVQGVGFYDTTLGNNGHVSYKGPFGGSVAEPSWRWWSSGPFLVLFGVAVAWIHILEGSYYQRMRGVNRTTAVMDIRYKRFCFQNTITP